MFTNFLLGKALIALPIVKSVINFKIRAFRSENKCSVKHFTS